MADFILLGLFDNVDITADVIEEVRGTGVPDQRMEVMSNIPYAARFFGRKPVRLWYLPFVIGGAAVGALLAYFITFVTPDLYPIHVGGQGLTPVPPTAIIFFELIALCTMVATFIGILLQARFPVLSPTMYDERITDGYIGLEVRVTNAQMDQVVAIFEAHHAHVIKREDASGYPERSIRHLLFWGGAGTVGLVALVIPLLLTFEIVKPPWINTMKDSVAVKFQESPRRAAPAEAIPVQGPVLIAGQPATRRLPDTLESQERGKTLFAINCAVCHGSTGGGDGLLTKYFQETPALNGERVQNLSDDDVFLVITNGKNRMPSLAENLSPGETWDIINYVRSLSSAPGSE
jgi:mono/diheme cytochrome c family protein